jgi:hypothetical protein
MRGLSLVLAGVVAAGLSLRAAQTPPEAPKAQNITGKWTMTFETPMGTSSPGLEFKQTGEKITGTYTGRYGAYPFEGTLKVRAIQFAFTMNAEGSPAEMVFRGEVAADGLSMRGQATLGEMGDTSWSAVKKPDK